MSKTTHTPELADEPIRTPTERPERDEPDTTDSRGVSLPTPSISKLQLLVLVALVLAVGYVWYRNQHARSSTTSTAIELTTEQAQDDDEDDDEEDHDDPIPDTEDPKERDAAALGYLRETGAMDGGE